MLLSLGSMGPNYFINSGKPNIFYKHLEHVFNHKSNGLNSPHSPNYEMQKYKRKKMKNITNYQSQVDERIRNGFRSSV